MEFLFEYLEPISAILVGGIITMGSGFLFILRQFIAQSNKVQQVVVSNTAALTRIDGTLNNMQEKINLSLDRDREMATALTEIKTVLASPLPRIMHHERVQNSRL